MGVIPAYRWLQNETGPKMILEGLRILGTKEVPGTGDNPLILAWAKEVGLQHEYEHDVIAWCGLVMAVIAKRSGKEIPDYPLWALNWADFGVRVNDGAKLGDIITFRRQGGGHVGLYVGEDDTFYHILGGNQADTVSIARWKKSSLYTIRRPHYINQPINVRKIVLLDSGHLAPVA